MKYFWIPLLAISMLNACKSPDTSEDKSTKEDTLEITFSFEESPTEFQISDSTGFLATFTKNKDSSFYHHLRFKSPEEQEMLKSALPVLSKLWSEADKKINIQLKSINVGHPLEYNDVLTDQVQAFSTSGQWGNRIITNDQNIDYSLVEDVMMENQVYPLEELLNAFGYSIKGYNIEKVGFVEPSRLIGIGYDESLKIPVPYMVWIQVEETQ